MRRNVISIDKQLSRRTVLGAAVAIAATPVLAEECRIGPPPHNKGLLVWTDRDQVEIDTAYDQAIYAPVADQIRKRYVCMSEAVWARLGQPQRVAYGPTDIEKLDVYRTKRPNAPIFVYIHGGAWLAGTAAGTAFPAELLVKAGAHYIALQIREADGDLRVMADQVRRCIAWVYKNATMFGGDANQLYIGGFSSGGHLAGVVLVTDWQKEFGLPADIVKGVGYA
jgi:arylformamidase